MMNNRCVPTNGNFFFSQPSHALTNIIDVLTGDSHNNIVRLSKFLFLRNFFTDIRYGFIYK